MAAGPEQHFEEALALARQQGLLRLLLELVQAGGRTRAWPTHPFAAPGWRSILVAELPAAAAATCCCQHATGQGQPLQR
jgi:hypothetical protein